MILARQHRGTTVSLTGPMLIQLINSLGYNFEEYSDIRIEKVDHTGGPENGNVIEIYLNFRETLEPKCRQTNQALIATLRGH